eukprot:gene24037-biopygen19385
MSVRTAVAARPNCRCEASPNGSVRCEGGLYRAASQRDKRQRMHAGYMAERGTTQLGNGRMPRVRGRCSQQPKRSASPRTTRQPPPLALRPLLGGCRGHAPQTMAQLGSEAYCERERAGRARARDKYPAHCELAKGTVELAQQRVAQRVAQLEQSMLGSAWPNSGVCEHACPISRGNRTVARAWRGHGAGVARATGHFCPWGGAGGARAWRGRGAGT